jgi:putative transposase
MLIAHKIELRPDALQAEYLTRACGIRRHAYNQLLAHFSQPNVKWSKKSAYEHLICVIRPSFPWYGEVSARVARNAIEDLDAAFSHFFRRVKAKQKMGGGYGYPTFKKKGLNDSFAMREAQKFSVNGKHLRIEKCPGRVPMRQALRFNGSTKQVTVSQQAGRFYAAILVDADNYDTKQQARAPIVGVDFGLTTLATLSDGTKTPSNRKLRDNLRRLKRRQRRMASKQRSSNRRAKAKLSIARLHQRIANQRRSVLHELSDALTRSFDTIVIEDLNVRGMVKNHSLALSVSDAGFGTLRTMLEYKARLRGNTIILADRFFPSSKTCSCCGSVNADVVLGVSAWTCPDCGAAHDRDINAAKNLEAYGLHTFAADLKRTQETGKTGASVLAQLLTA